MGAKKGGKKPYIIWVKDPIITLDAAKIKMLQKLISRDRKLWMRWIKRKLIRVANTWKVEESMSAKPTRQQRKNLSKPA